MKRSIDLLVERIARMDEEMRRMFNERLGEQAAREVAAPAELQAITARIEQLQTRLTTGDPNLEPDDIQAAIDREEDKRRDKGTALRKDRGTTRNYRAPSWRGPVESSNFAESWRRRQTAA